MHRMARSYAGSPNMKVDRIGTLYRDSLTDSGEGGRCDVQIPRTTRPGSGLKREGMRHGPCHRLY